MVKRARKAIEGAGEKIDDKVFDRFAKRLSYLHGDVTDSALYDALAKQIGSQDHCLFYLEMPPSLFAPIVENLGKAGLLDGIPRRGGEAFRSRPDVRGRTQRRGCVRCWTRTRSSGWTTSWARSRSSNWSICASATWRWPSCGIATVISEIQITMAENFGVDDRGKFYDGVGALRDVVQNHLLQVLAGVAMEPPVGPSADDLNDKKADVLRGDTRNRPGAQRPGSVSRLHRRPRRGQGFDDRDLRRAAGGDRQLAVGRGADLFARGQGADRTGYRGAVVHPPRPLAELSCRTVDGPNPTRSCCGSTLIPACACS